MGTLSQKFFCDSKKKMKKSVITCDLEGIILTMNNGAEDIFGYKKDELIGKKRVSLFSPGEIVLQNVENWLKKSVEEGSYEGLTVFLNKQGKRINAKIIITPLYKDGKENPHTGYCGITELVDEEVVPKINFTTKIIKWLAITRMPFTSASILPILCIASYFAYIGDNLFNPLSLVYTIFGIIFAHISINIFNDYFDYIDGTDENNYEYFQQVSGGSRSIELGLISLRKTKLYAIIMLLVSFVFAALVLSQSNVNNIYGIFIVSLLGLILGYFYTARPLRLVSRRGLGELSIFLTFGPLLTIGVGFAIFDGDFWVSEYFLDCLLMGLIFGLLTTNILLINQFPDMNGDIKTGKNNLVVTFGKKNSRWIYAIILGLSFISSFYFCYILENYLLLIPTLIILFNGSYILKILFQNYDDRKLVKANWHTIYLHALYGICTLIVFYFS